MDVPSFRLSSVGASTLIEVNKILTYDSKMKVAKASMTEALTSQYFLNRS